MHVWLCDGLGVLVNGVAQVRGIHYVQEDGAEERQDLQIFG